MKLQFKSIIIIASTLGLLSSCGDYLDTSSPSNADDAFVSSTSVETLKVLSKGYALLRESCKSAYDWNDHFCSDTEYFPENNSSNNINAKLVPENVPCDYMKDSFNSLYEVASYAQKAIDMIDSKQEYQDDVAANRKSDWTQLKGEAEGMRAYAYFELLRHIGDIPYGYENENTSDYELSSRFDVYDDLINRLKSVEPLMYSVGENSINSERISRTYVCGLIGKMALYSAGWQTIRTDMPELYGNVQFTTKSTDDKRKAAYVRRTDTEQYLSTAETYLGKALGEAAGTTKLVVDDERANANNPFQRHFQYVMDLQRSPEMVFEIGTMENQTTSRLYSYDLGRACNGGSNTAPNKVFGALRIIPTFYYGGFDNADKRRDVNGVVTGLDGKGNEVLYSYKAGAKTDGGICWNKYDICRETPYFVGKQMGAGYSLPIMRLADVILLHAEAKAELGKSAEAVALVNQIRQRAFGNASHNIGNLTGQQLLDAVFQERKLELCGEGDARYDMVRSGKFAERAIAMRNEMRQLGEDLKSKGYHEFDNGNVFPAYVWTKKISGARLTYDATDTTDPVEFPGWRGVLDFSALGLTVSGTDHNLAIKGLFRYIAPGSSEATQLESEGYSRTDWGKTLADNIDIYLSNMLPGITSESSVPCYFWPIPYETVSQSKGKVTNGYGLPQE